MTVSSPVLLRLAWPALLAAVAATTMVAAPFALGGPAPTQPAAVQGGGRTGGAAGARGDWWNDPQIRRDLKLTDEQAERIKDIFEKREQEVRPFWDMLNRDNDRLVRMTRERVANEAEYSAQVAKVEALYARLRESRTIMVYRMYRELQPEQYKKLVEILDRRRAADGRGGSAGPGR